MNRLLAGIVGGTLALGLSGCDILFGGGGTGGSTIDFTSGYVFIRDNAVFAVDSSDVNDAVQLSEGTELCAEPSISADGTQVVFVQQEAAGGWTLRATAVRGGTAVRTLLSGANRYRNPVFSPDGLTVVFSYDVDSSTSHLGRVDAAGTGGFEDLTPTATDQLRSPTFYPNGTDVLVAVGTGGVFTQLQKLNLDTGLTTSVATTLGSAASQLAKRVVISSLGDKAVFDARPATGGAPRIYVKDITTDTGTATVLTEHPGYEATVDSYPTWAGITAVGFSTNDGGNDNINEIAAAPTAPAPGTLTIPGAREGWFGSVP
jgi:hypothetical protein